jgi:hypothetical protein
MSELVEEQDLDFSQFHCCGDEDLYPFGCPQCNRLMIFCYECDTLYDNLEHLASQDTKVNNSNVNEALFSCPGCRFAFPHTFVQRGAFKVSRIIWRQAGFMQLLKNHEA